MRFRGMAARCGSTLLAGALIATLLVLVGGGPRDVLVPLATNTKLCSGYSGCRSAGYSDAGYGAVNDRMYWRMYSGHNCTNYVAYRMIRAGMSTTRPWTGGGNASEWGLHMKSITDQVPNVGAVAWWGRYSNGSGSAGHVAYVERVISSTEIIISEDSWGGTFHWRRLSKDSGRWPTGFIHFVDKTVKAKAAPAVTGTTAVGQTLTASPGSWSVTPTSVHYNWHVDGVSTGVLTRTFTPRAADLGKAVTVKVRAKRTGYTDGVQFSTATPAVAKGTFVLNEQPTVTGTPYVDETLTASAGTWAPAPKVMGWRWYADGTRIAGNDGSQLALTRALVGKKITVIPVARQDGYNIATAPTLDAGTVTMGTIGVTAPYAVTGSPVVGQTLSLTPGVTDPADATPTYQWLRDGKAVPGATGTTYRLTGDDAGSKISARVDLTRRNYAATSQTLPATATVTSPARIVIVTDGRSRTAYARVRVAAKGVQPVEGRVLIRIGRWTDEVRLVDGRARVSVRVADLGRKDVAVRYLGSTSVPAARATTTVTVR